MGPPKYYMNTLYYHDVTVQPPQCHRLFPIDTTMFRTLFVTVRFYLFICVGTYIRYFVSQLTIIFTRTLKSTEIKP